jgi:DNA-binding beta-propeller fold protein YncE
MAYVDLIYDLDCPKAWSLPDSSAFIPQAYVLLAMLQSAGRKRFPSVNGRRVQARITRSPCVLDRLPTDVALNRNGMLYVSDSYANRIQVFDIAGKPVNKWGGPFAVGIPGPFNGWFRVVTGIAVGAQGDIFAADFYNHRVQKFRGDGTIFAVDFANNRIEKWRPTRS